MTESQKKVPYFSLSIVLHAILIVIIFYIGAIKNFLGFKDSLEVIHIKRAIQVDVVEMPKVSLQELKELPSLNVPEVEKKLEPEPIKEDEPIVVEKVNLLERLQKLAQQKVDKPKRKKRRQEVSKEDLQRTKELKQLVMSGNKIVQGSFSFEDTTSSGEVLNSYLSLMIEKIRTQWKLPGYLMDQDLKCRVRIYLNNKGSLLKSELVESSGNQDFDQRAMSAIEKTSPFGSVPKEIQDSLSDGKILLGFPI